MVGVLLLLAALQAQDPVQVRARLNDEEIHAGETTVLRVDVQTDGERAQIQRFRSLPPGLELQGTRDYDQRQFSIPGGTRRFISREFVLRARAAGRYRIPAVEVIVDGQHYSTRSLLLTVTASAARASGEAGEQSADGVILRTWLDSDTVFVGEQVTLESEAMFSQDARLRLRRAPEYEPPSPSGFWVHDLPDGRRATTRTIGREAYEVQHFRRAFFPLSPGRYEIPPARLEYEIRRGLLYAPETREITSDPLPLVVLPVPADEPPAFTGAVGDYTLRAWLEPSRVPAGEAATLTVEVDGVGNVKALPPPSLPDLEGIDVFPPGEEADTEIRGTEVRGSKRFSWVLIPREAGELEIPEIRYAFFDPEARGFETASVPAMTLRVTPGTGTEDAPPAATLRYLHPSPGSADRLGWVGSPWFAAAQLLPLLLVVGALGWRRRGGRDRPASRRALRRRRRRRLRELQDRVAESDGALFADAERFARDWLAERLGLSRAEAGRPEALEAAGVAPETARSVRGLLDRLAAARYAPEPPGADARRNLLGALGRLLDRADSEAASPRSRGREAAAPLLLLPLMLGAASGPAAASAEGVPQAVDAPADRFQAGVRAFDDQRYLDAAEAFDRYLAERPRDPQGWYNLGTAYYRGGYRGYGIWAWLRVPRLDPRHEDVRHNLRVADVPPELVARVAPPFPARPAELFVLASLAWLISGIAAAAWLLRSSKRAGVAAGLALLAALALAGAGWASTRDAETLIVLEAATLRTGPTLRADPVAELEPGTGLVPVDSVEGWVRGRTLRGAEGWIEATTTGRL